MKSTRTKKRILATVLLFSVVCTASAQFTKLLDFDATNGKYPMGSLVSDGTYLYGMTTAGDNIFKIKPDGTGYQYLYHLTFPDGTSPGGSLYYDGTWLYGTTQYSGGSWGTVFRIKPDGTNFSVIHSMSSSGYGLYPMGSLISDGTWLYGMGNGGNGNFGSVFKLMPDGSNFTNLHNFGASQFDGARPRGSLVTDGTWLYGMTEHGGYTDQGTIFKVQTDGSGYVMLYSFVTSTGCSPYGDLIYDGTYLYGMTRDAGPSGHGTIFRIQTDGNNYTNVHAFGLASDGLGCEPHGSLISDGTWFYGMTYFGSNMFKIKPDGSDFTVMYNMTGADGAGPNGSLISDGSFLYGMAYGGGVNGYGTLFKLDINSVVGIPFSEKKEAAFAVYPNPAEDQLTLAWKKQSKKINESVEYTIRDPLGKIVLQSTANMQNTAITIDLQDLQSGMYFLKTDDGIVKFVKK